MEDALPLTQRKVNEMVKVFISNIDVSFGHNLSHVLSQTVVGARNAEEEEEDQTAAPPPPPVDGTAPLVKEKPQKERYIINGTFSPDINALGESVLLPSYAKPGKMIETGDKKKDAARREAIEKIPIRGVKPKWVSDCAAVRSIRHY